MPAYGSGLSAQLMLAAESTVGTEVTTTTGYEILSEDLAYDPTWIEGQGLRAGQAYKRISRVSISRHGVKGGFLVEHLDKGHFPLLWKHAIGSALTVPVQIAASTAYKSILTPGAKTAMGLSVQVGRPQTDATVRPFTYRGCKVTDWEFSVSDNQMAQLKLTMDGWQEATATTLAAASYTSGASLFSFADASLFKLGGTPSTAAGEITVAGGTPIVSIVKGFTIKGTTPLAGERYGLGNSGVKKEQIDNGIPLITVSLDTEFTQRTELYDLMKANTTTALEFALSHGDAGGSNPFLLSFIVPAMKVKAASQNVNGPDIIGSKVELEGYDDGVNAPFQVKLVSSDTTL